MIKKNKIQLQRSKHSSSVEEKIQKIGMKLSDTMDKKSIHMNAVSKPDPLACHIQSHKIEN
jgi:hypothetical protein